MIGNAVKRRHGPVTFEAKDLVKRIQGLVSGGAKSSVADTTFQALEENGRKDDTFSGFRSLACRG